LSISKATKLRIVPDIASPLVNSSKSVLINIFFRRTPFRQLLGRHFQLQRAYFGSLLTVHKIKNNPIPNHSSKTEVRNDMNKYLLLLALDKAKLLETIDALRKLPRNPSPGVDLNYTMNIFGTWHVAVWFSSTTLHKPQNS